MEGKAKRTVNGEKTALLFTGESAGVELIVNMTTVST